MTRPDKYAGENLAKQDLSIRQGYYILAESEEQAQQKMKEMFPNDSKFDSQVWKRDVRAQGD
jgi:hypothetical protein